MVVLNIHVGHRFVVKDSFDVAGRGLVLTGLSDGLIALGDIYRLGDGSSFQVRGIESWTNGVTPKGETVGVLLGKVDKNLFPIGTALYRVGPVDHPDVNGPD